MNGTLRSPGETITLSMAIIDEVAPANNPVTGEAPTVAIRRLSDNKWYDFLANDWDNVGDYASLGAEHKYNLTDNQDGTYSTTWDQDAADNGTETNYCMVYEVPSGTYQGIAYEYLSFSYEWRDDILSDGNSFMGSNIDTAISSRSSHTAADVASAVWSYTTRTLSAFGNLIADIWSYATRTLTQGLSGDVNVTSVGGTTVSGPDDLKASGFAVPGDNMGITSAGASTIDTALSVTHGAGLWTASLGSGSKACTIHVEDNNGNDVVGISVTVKNNNQTTNIGVATTNSEGNTPAFGLEPLTDYKVVLQSSSPYSFSNPYSITTSSSNDAESFTLTCTAASVTPPTEADYCTIYCWVREEDGSVPASGALKVTKVYSPATTGDGDTTISVVLGDNPASIDDTGYAAITILRGAQVDIELTTTTRPIPVTKRRVTIPDTPTANWETLSTS